MVILWGNPLASSIIKYSERWFRSNFVFKFCPWVLKMDPYPEGPWCLQALGCQDRPPPAGVAGSGFCMSASCLCFKCCSHLLVWCFCFPLCHFFFPFSLTFSLHADKFPCFTSPKTPSSSWMSHLSERCSLSLPPLTLGLSLSTLP